MKKPDRFERMVDKVKCGPGPDRYFLRPGHVVALLRKEHKAVVRMVEDYAKHCVPPGNERCPTAWEAVPIIEKVCQDILDQLRRRAT